MNTTQFFVMFRYLQFQLPEVCNVFLSRASEARREIILTRLHRSRAQSAETLGQIYKWAGLFGHRGAVLTRCFNPAPVV